MEEELWEILRNLEMGKISVTYANDRISHLFSVSGSLPPIDVEKCYLDDALTLLNQLEKEVSKHNEQMFLNMQYYMEYCQKNGYVTPQEWILKHKHF